MGILLFSLISISLPQKSVSGREGTINLRSWNFSEDKLVSLEGSWQIVKSAFILPGNFQDFSSGRNGEYIKIPDNILDVSGKYGYCTLRFRIILPDDSESYGFRVSEILSASKIWINGEYKGEIGKVSETPENSLPQYKILYLYDTPKEGSLDIVIHTSNYEIPYPRIMGITFGRAQDIKEFAVKNLIVIAAKIGMLIFLIVTTLIMISLKNFGKHGYSYIFLCLFSLIRLCVLNERIVLYFFPDIGYEVISKIASITYYLWLAFLARLFRNRSDDFSNKVYLTVFSMSVMISFVAFITPSVIYDRLGYLGQGAGVFLLMYILYYLSKKIITGEMTYVILLVGMLLLGISTINDILLNNRVVETIYFADNGMIIFLLIEMYYEFKSKFIKLNRLEFLAEENLRIKEISVKDSLTGAYNRRFLDEFLRVSLKRFIEEGRRFSVIFIDIDKFKFINDKYGHTVGDLVLVDIVSLIKENIDKEDVLGRYGGEEFVVIIPDSKESVAIHKAEKIRIAVKNKIWDHGDFNLTVSLGVYENSKRDLNEVYSHVDNLMYIAKRSGRNKVISGSNQEAVDFIY